jgi:hypothetical protein
MDFLSVVIIALIGESIWETLKMIWQQGKVNIDRIGALVIGLLIAVASGIDIMEVIGIPMYIPYLGIILTGILISRGANFIHDILEAVNNMRQKGRS